jgi:hypothetical protein
LKDSRNHSLVFIKDLTAIQRQYYCRSGETKQINFNAGVAGTYFYYGEKGPFPHIEIQLYGALIIDAKKRAT